MRKFFAIIFFIILVFPLIFGTQTAISVVTWALDRDFYIETFDQPEVYAALGSDALVGELLAAKLNLPPGVDTGALSSIINDVLTPEFLQTQIRAYFNGFFDYLQGRTNEFTPVIDLRPLKTAIAGDQQDAFLAALLQSLPVCEPGQTPGFGNENEYACKPAGISDQLIIEQALKPALPAVLAQIPDQVPLEGKIGSPGNNSNWRTFLPGMAAPASIMLSVLILTVVSVAVWYLIALIADPNWHGRLQWLGWMLFIPSLLVFLLGFAAQGGVAAYWINFGLARARLAAAPIGTELAESMQIVAMSALPRVSNAFKMVGGIGGALALALIFWGIATPRKREI